MEPFDRQRLTRALSAAAIDPTHWAEALAAVAACTGSHGAVLLPVIGALPALAATTSMEDAMELYIGGEWHVRDERHRAVPSFLKKGVVTDDDCMPREVRKRSPYYQDFLGACNFTDWAGVRVGRDELVWCLSVQRTADQGPFSAIELTWLSELANSLDSVAQTSAALGLAKGESALDAFGFSERAAVLLDRRGSVVRVNDAAERLIGDDIQISGGRVLCRDPKSNERLALAIKDLLWSYKSSTTPPVVFPKASGGKFIVYPMRLPGLTSSPLSAFHAILVISDTDAVHAGAMLTVRQAFDLTAAEAHLAVAIAAGKDLETFSAERQLSKETVRNQLKSIFLKTGTNRQAQLAVMLSTLIPNR
jgi:DNA-binding CsgD family transcriptional regulator